MEDDLGGFAVVAVALLALAFVVQVILAVLQVIAMVVGTLLIVGLVLAFFVGTGVGSNVLLRALIGVWGNLAGDQEDLALERARWGLVALYVAPILFMGDLVVLMLLVDSRELVILAPFALVSLPAYYWAWFTQTIPGISSEDDRLKHTEPQGIELSFRSEGLMRAEEKLLWGRFRLWLAYQRFRLQLYLADRGGRNGYPE